MAKRGMNDKELTLIVDLKADISDLQRKAQQAKDIINTFFAQKKAFEQLNADRSRDLFSSKDLKSQDMANLKVLEDKISAAKKELASAAETLSNNINIKINSSGVAALNEEYAEQIQLLKQIEEQAKRVGKAAISASNRPLISPINDLSNTIGKLPISSSATSSISTNLTRMPQLMGKVVSDFDGVIVNIDHAIVEVLRKLQEAGKLSRAPFDYTTTKFDKRELIMRPQYRIEDATAGGDKAVGGAVWNEAISRPELYQGLFDQINPMWKEILQKFKEGIITELVVLSDTTNEEVALIKKQLIDYSLKQAGMDPLKNKVTFVPTGNGLVRPRDNVASAEMQGFLRDSVFSSIADPKQGSLAAFVDKATAIAHFIKDFDVYIDDKVEEHKKVVEGLSALGAGQKDRLFLAPQTGYNRTYGNKNLEQTVGAYGQGKYYDPNTLQSSANWAEAVPGAYTTQKTFVQKVKDNIETPTNQIARMGHYAQEMEKDLSLAQETLQALQKSGAYLADDLAPAVKVVEDLLNGLLKVKDTITETSKIDPVTKKQGPVANIYQSIRDNLKGPAGELKTEVTTTNGMRNIKDLFMRPLMERPNTETLSTLHKSGIAEYLKTFYLEIQKKIRFNEIQDDAALKEYLNSIKGASQVGLDTEGPREAGKYGTRTMQLHAEGTPPAFIDLKKVSDKGFKHLQSFLLNKDGHNSTKIIQNASYDIAQLLANLAHELKIDLPTMKQFFKVFDTRIAAETIEPLRVLQGTISSNEIAEKDLDTRRPGASLGRLSQEILGMPIDKSSQGEAGSWAAQNIAQAKKVYAVTDAVVTNLIGDKLQGLLGKADQLHLPGLDSYNTRIRAMWTGIEASMKGLSAAAASFAATNHMYAEHLSSTMNASLKEYNPTKAAENITQASIDFAKDASTEITAPIFDNFRDSFINTLAPLSKDMQRATLAVMYNKPVTSKSPEQSLQEQMFAMSQDGKIRGRDLEAALQQYVGNPKASGTMKATIEQIFAAIPKNAEQRAAAFANSYVKMLLAALDTIKMNPSTLSPDRLVQSAGADRTASGHYGNLGSSREAQTYLEYAQNTQYHTKQASQLEELVPVVDTVIKQEGFFHAALATVDENTRKDLLQRAKLFQQLITDITNLQAQMVRTPLGKGGQLSPESIEMMSQINFLRDKALNTWDPEQLKTVLSTAPVGVQIYAKGKQSKDQLPLTTFKGIEAEQTRLYNEKYASTAGMSDLINSLQTNTFDGFDDQQKKNFNLIADTVKSERIVPSNLTNIVRVLGKKLGNEASEAGKKVLSDFTELLGEKINALADSENLLETLGTGTVSTEPITRTEAGARTSLHIEPTTGNTRSAIFAELEKKVNSYADIIGARTASKQDHLVPAELINTLNLAGSGDIGTQVADLMMNQYKALIAPLKAYKRAKDLIGENIKKLTPISPDAAEVDRKKYETGVKEVLGSFRKEATEQITKSTKIINAINQIKTPLTAEQSTLRDSHSQIKNMYSSMSGLDDKDLKTELRDYYQLQMRKIIENTGKAVLLAEKEMGTIIEEVLPNTGQIDTDNFKSKQVASLLISSKMFQADANRYAGEGNARAAENATRYSLQAKGAAVMHTLLGDKTAYLQQNKSAGLLEELSLTEKEAQRQLSHLQNKTSIPAVTAQTKYKPNMLSGINEAGETPQEIILKLTNLRYDILQEVEATDALLSSLSNTIDQIQVQAAEKPNDTILAAELLQKKDTFNKVQNTKQKLLQRQNDIDVGLDTAQADIDNANTFKATQEYAAKQRKFAYALRKENRGESGGGKRSGKGSIQSWDAQLKEAVRLEGELNQHRLALVELINAGSESPEASQSLKVSLENNLREVEENKKNIERLRPLAHAETKKIKISKSDIPSIDKQQMFIKSRKEAYVKAQEALLVAQSTQEKYGQSTDPADLLMANQAMIDEAKAKSRMASAEQDLNKRGVAVPVGTVDKVKQAKAKLGVFFQRYGNKITEFTDPQKGELEQLLTELDIAQIDVNTQKTITDIKFRAKQEAIALRKAYVEAIIGAATNKTPEAVSEMYTLGQQVYGDKKGPDQAREITSRAYRAQITSMVRPQEQALNILNAIRANPEISADQFDVSHLDGLLHTLQLSFEQVKNLSKQDLDKLIANTTERIAINNKAIATLSTKGKLASRNVINQELNDALAEFSVDYSKQLNVVKSNTTDVIDVANKMDEWLKTSASYARVKSAQLAKEAFTSAIDRTKTSKVKAGTSGSDSSSALEQMRAEVAKNREGAFAIAQEKLQQGMSMNQITKLPDFKQFIASAKEAQQNIHAINAELGEAGAGGTGSKGRGLAGTLIRVATTLGSIWFMITRIQWTVQRLVQPGLEYSKQVESTAVGLAGILMSMSRINNETLTWGQSLYTAQAIVRKIQDASALTGVGADDLQRLVQSIMGAGFMAQMSIDQIVRLGTVGASAIKQLGLPDAQFVQEMRDLVQGGIQVQSSVLATQLGITDSILDQVRGTGQLYSYLMERLKGFQTSQLAYLDTYEGRMSVVDNVIKRISSEGMKPLFESLKDLAGRFIEAIATIDRETGKIKINPEIRAQIRDLTRDLMTMVNQVINMGIALAKTFNMISNSPIAGPIKGIFSLLTKDIGAFITTLLLGTAIYKNFLGLGISAHTRKDMWSGPKEFGRKYIETPIFGPGVGAKVAPAPATVATAATITPTSSSPTVVQVVPSIQKVTAALKEAERATTQAVKNMGSTLNTFWAASTAGMIKFSQVTGAKLASIGRSFARSIPGLILTVVTMVASNAIFSKLSSLMNDADTLQTKGTKVTSWESMREAAIENAKKGSESTGVDFEKRIEKEYDEKKEKLDAEFNKGEVNKEDYISRLTAIMEAEGKEYLNTVVPLFKNKQARIDELTRTITQLESDGMTDYVALSTLMAERSTLQTEIAPMLQTYKDMEAQIRDVRKNASAKLELKAAFSIQDEGTIKGIKSAVSAFWNAQIQTALDRSKQAIQIMQENLDHDKERHRVSIQEYYEKRIALQQRATELEISAARAKQDLIVKEISSVMASITDVIKDTLNMLPKVTPTKPIDSTSSRDAGAAAGIASNNKLVIDDQADLTTLDDSFRINFVRAWEAAANDPELQRLLGKQIKELIVTSTLRPGDTGSNHSLGLAADAVADFMDAFDESLNGIAARNRLATIFSKYNVAPLFEITPEEQRKYQRGNYTPVIHTTPTGLESNAWSPKGEINTQRSNLWKQQVAQQQLAAPALATIEQIQSRMTDVASKAGKTGAIWAKIILENNNVVGNNREVIKGLTDTWGIYAADISKASEAVNSHTTYLGLDAEQERLKRAGLQETIKTTRLYMQEIGDLLTTITKFNMTTIAQKDVTFRQNNTGAIPQIPWEQFAQAFQEGPQIYAKEVALFINELAQTNESIAPAVYEVITNLSNSFTQIAKNISLVTDPTGSAMSKLVTDFNQQAAKLLEPKIIEQFGQKLDALQLLIDNKVSVLEGSYLQGKISGTDYVKGITDLTKDPEIAEANKMLESGVNSFIKKMGMQSVESQKKIKEMVLRTRTILSAPLENAQLIAQNQKEQQLLDISSKYGTLDHPQKPKVLAQYREEIAATKEYISVLEQVISVKQSWLNSNKEGIFNNKNPQEVAAWLNEAAAVRKLREEVAKLKQESRKINLFGVAILEETEVIEKFGSIIGDAFSSIIDGSKSVGDSFRDMAYNIIKYIGQAIVQIYAMRAAQAAVGFLGSLFGASAGSSSCFIAGTLIRTPFGKLPIEQLILNNQVVSFDNNMSKKNDVITHIMSRNVIGYYQLTIGDTILSVTAEHPIRTSQGWVKVKDLVLGDNIYCWYGTQDITSIQYVDEEVTVYNITVKDNHTYYANDIAVHNKMQPFQFREGGNVRGPGTATSDSIWARVSNGEYIIKAATVSQYGVDFMDRLNRGLIVPKYATGGLVGNSASAISTNSNTNQSAQSFNFSPTINVASASKEDANRLSDQISQQWQLFRGQILNDMRNNSSMRTAIKGVMK